jgi:hypothetical protein
MTATTTKIFQLLATVLQILNAVNVAQLPAKWQAAFTGILTIAQAIQGVAAHYFTPGGNAIDGTTGQVTSTGGTVVANVPVTKQ